MKSFKQFIIETKTKPIGKLIQGWRYLHRKYENTLPDQEGLEKAKSVLSSEHREKYNIVKHNKSTGQFAFIHSPDFDTSPEPISGESHLVHPDGRVSITKQNKDPWIYHHKHEWVGPDYTGFDIEKSKQRSKNWSKVTDKIKKENPEEQVMRKIGKKSYWENNIVPHIEE